MKNIKFRAWNKTVKKFTYFGTDEPSIEYNADDKVGMFLEATNNVYISAYEEPQQYTGIKDKNCKEIYEGDILASTEYPFQDNGVYNYHAEVIYFKNCPSFGYIEHCVNPNKSGINEGMGESFEDNEQGEMFEVIGNIYENPELLKK